MNSVLGWLGRIGAVMFMFGGTATAAQFRVATYNLEGYLVSPSESRPAKSAEACEKIRESIQALKPDVLAVQEIGGQGALMSLRDSLKAAGLDFPYCEHVAGPDTNVQVAVLSRYPFTARRPHTNENFLLSGRRYQVSRGFGEVDIQVNPGYSFTLITAHLKSKRPVFLADETELRLEEAKILRRKIDARLEQDPEANLIVLGDFNDTKDSPAIKAVIGRGKHKLVDTRPAERNGDAADETGSRQGRTVTWTHYYAKEDTYSRIDFLFLSRGMAHEWLPDGTYVLAIAGWGLGSDHRPLVAAFEAEEK